MRVKVIYTNAPGGVEHAGWLIVEVSLVYEFVEV